MSGHSKWSTIKRKKAKNDQARGKLFSRLTKEIIVAARDGGGDPEMNPRLRTAIDNAKANNLPNDNIERAILRGTGDLPGVDYEQAWYEGYAPGGVALLVETLTDNKNRTVSEIRHLLTKYGGSMAETGAVSWQFETKGTLLVDDEEVEEDELMMVVLEAGAEDMESEEDGFYVTSPVDDFETVKDALRDEGISFKDAQLSRIPKTLLELETGEQERVLKLLEAIEEQDDVQNLYTNLDIDEELAEAAAEE